MLDRVLYREQTQETNIIADYMKQYNQDQDLMPPYTEHLKGSDPVYEFN